VCCVLLFGVLFNYCSESVGVSAFSFEQPPLHFIACRCCFVGSISRPMRPLGKVETGHGSLV
jgi:hypothetical protein